VVAVSERRIAQGRALGSEEHLPLGLPALQVPVGIGRLHHAVSERRVAQGRALGSEEHLPLGLPALQVPVGIGRLHQREVAVNAQAQHARTHPGQHVPGPRQ